jgi:putative phosphonoacetaldehyde dehydrogenase
MFVDAAMVEHARERHDIRNPYNGEVVGSIALDRAEDAEQAAAAAAGFMRGGIPDATVRAEVLRRTAEALRARREEFARLITSESGNCLKDSYKEVDRSVGNLLVSAEEATRIHGEALRLTAGGSGKVALTLHEPVGVVVAITPFNRPLNQVVVKVAPAIAAGNAVVVKPSERTPLSAYAFARLMVEQGLPGGMLAVVSGKPSEIGNALVDSPHVSMVTFTGGVATGEAVARRAGLKKILLELGGNDPFIVLADADLKKAARIAAEGSVATAGQSCRGIKRILVAHEVADAFVPLLVEEVARRRWGDPADPDTDVGCLITDEAADQAERRCRSAVADGATLVYGGARRGRLFQPTVLDRVRPDSEIVMQETFAPFAPVIRVSGPDEAVEIANGTEYGLQAGVATRDAQVFLDIARRLKVGAVNYMEGPNFDSPMIPFGGVKKSGIGREGIRYSMREMTTVKTVLLPWAET